MGNVTYQIAGARLFIVIIVLLPPLYLLINCFPIDGRKKWFAFATHFVRVFHNLITYMHNRLFVDYKYRLQIWSNFNIPIKSFKILNIAFKAVIIFDANYLCFDHELLHINKLPCIFNILVNPAPCKQINLFVSFVSITQFWWDWELIFMWIFRITRFICIRMNMLFSFYLLHFFSFQFFEAGGFLGISMKVLYFDVTISAIWFFSIMDALWYLNWLQCLILSALCSDCILLLCFIYSTFVYHVNSSLIAIHIKVFSHALCELHDHIVVTLIFVLVFVRVCKPKYFLEFVYL